MAFSAQVGLGGLSGWKFVEKTSFAQKTTLSKDVEFLRSKQYFVSKMRGVNNSDDIVEDFRLLKFVLESHHLESDIKNKAFIKKGISSDLSDPKSFVNKLADKAYLRLAETLSDLKSGRALDSVAVSKLVDMNVESHFESSVGDKDNSIRLVLNARREVEIMSRKGVGDSARWYGVLGSKSLRLFFEGALGGAGWLRNLPIDRQFDYIKSRMDKVFRVVRFEEVTSSDVFEKMATKFLMNEMLLSKTGIGKSYILKLLR